MEAIPYETLSAEELLNAVLARLIAQGSASVKDTNTGETCAYRGDNGKACSAGHCIPDPIYSPNMEGANWSELLIVYSSSLSSAHADLIEMMQAAHDGFSYPLGRKDDDGKEIIPVAPFMSIAKGDRWEEAIRHRFGIIANHLQLKITV